MTIKEASERADQFAKDAMLFVPLGWLFTAFVIVTQAAQPSYIWAGLFVSALIAFVILVICLAPSWILEKWLFLREPRTKSEIVKQAAKKHGLPVIDIKLSTMDPKDLRGLPDKWE